MEQEKTMSGEENLALISKTIHEAQGYFYESGMGALILGFSILVCSLFSFAWDKHLIGFPFHPFFLLIPVIIIQIWLQANEEKKKKAKTFTDEAIDGIWTGFFVASIAAWCTGFAGLQYIAVVIILFLAGFATLVTGLVAKFSYNIICGCICLGLGVFSVFILSPEIYFLLGAAAALAFIVPGFILRNIFKKQQYAGR